MEDHGEPLAVEDSSEDTSEIIWNQIEVVMGKRFWDIEPDEKALRYLFVNQNSAVLELEISPTLEPENNNEAIRTKKWWEFWK